MSKTLESKVQDKLIKELKKAGWVTNKPVQNSYNGWPDIQAFKHPGRTIFIEVKRKGEKPRKLQKYWIRQLSDMGFPVLICEGMEDIDEILNVIAKLR